MQTQKGRAPACDLRPEARRGGQLPVSARGLRSLGMVLRQIGRARTAPAPQPRLDQNQRLPQPQHQRGILDVLAGGTPMQVLRMVRRLERAAQRGHQPPAPSRHSAPLRRPARQGRPAPPSSRGGERPPLTSGICPRAPCAFAKAPRVSIIARTSAVSENSRAISAVAEEVAVKRAVEGRDAHDAASGRWPISSRNRLRMAA